MRILAFIFSVYVMSLAFWPCGDNADAEYHDITHAQEQSHDHNHSHGHDHDHGGEEPCSPFCSCQCCQISIHLPVAFFQSIIPQPAIDEQDAYLATIPDSPGKTFFIPPRG